MRTRTRVLGIAMTGLLGLGAGLAAPAFACTDLAQIKVVSSNSGPAGAEIVLGLTGYSPVTAEVEPVEIRWNTTEGQPLATVATTTKYNAEGDVVTSPKDGKVVANDVTVRILVPDVVPGIHVIDARQSEKDGDVIGKHATTFQVTPASSAPTSGGGDVVEQPQQQAQPHTQPQPQPQPQPTAAATPGAGSRGPSLTPVASQPREAALPGAASHAAAEPGVTGQAAPDTVAPAVSDDGDAELEHLPLTLPQEMWSGLEGGGSGLLDPPAGGAATGPSNAAVGAALLLAGMAAVAGTGAVVGRRRLQLVRAARSRSSVRSRCTGT